jgi:hydroxymethylpyrimidine pyrophosphatase-like HAD family hydrolase
MQADLRSMIDTMKGTLVNPELIHDSVDLVYVGSALNELTDDLTNIMLVTNLVHIRLMEVAEEVDITAIVFSNGHLPKPKEIKRAQELEIDLITTPLTLEEVHRQLKAEYGTTLDIKTSIVPSI